MDRYIKKIIFIIAIIIFIAFNQAVLHANNSSSEKQISTQEQAAKHAAKLANEKCQKDFGHAPFKPESYKAEFIDSKWHWGKFDPIGIHGYSAKVEFSEDSSDEDVRVVFYTDAIDNKDISPNNKSENTGIGKIDKLGIELEKILKEKKKEDDDKSQTK